MHRGRSRYYPPVSILVLASAGAGWNWTWLIGRLDVGRASGGSSGGASS
jgi:hypothetical protein